MFKLLNRLTAWYFRNLIIANQKILSENSVINNTPNLQFRSTIAMLSNDLSIAAPTRKILMEYLYRSRKEMLKNE